ncbi:hypothetical protein VCR15J2_390028 [Vibrio coralliirubri]|nr:hypothetical protein [Vibrio coralliirubri]CDT52916.1 hypothetical protein VCR15J2_390028 [Vibrio coralliirubri]
MIKYYVDGQFVAQVRSNGGRMPLATIVNSERKPITVRPEPKKK